MRAVVMNRAECTEGGGIFLPSAVQRRGAGEFLTTWPGKVGSRRGLLTVVEAAEYLRISAATLRRLEKGGNIRYCAIGRKHFYTIEDLEAFLSRSACGPRREEGGYDDK